jgi:hypothetical protein
MVQQMNLQDSGTTLKYGATATPTLDTHYLAELLWQC